MHPWQDSLIELELELCDSGRSGPKQAPASSDQGASLLTQFGIIAVTGADSATFLQSQFSSDVAQVTDEKAQFGSFSTAKGRMLANFILLKRENDYLLVTPLANLEAFVSRLSMFVMRAKVSISDITASHLALGAWNTFNTPESWLPEACASLENLQTKTINDATFLRMPGLVHRTLVIAPIDQAKQLIQTAMQSLKSLSTSEHWDQMDIRAGIPWITEATREALVPQMGNLDLLGGISFKKGCYPGQEIVARMHYLGNLKRRTFLLEGEAPAPGERLVNAEGNSIGLVINRVPGFCLATLQLDALTKGDMPQSEAGEILSVANLPYQSQLVPTAT